jgi:hypothetical protein
MRFTPRANPFSDGCVTLPAQQASLVGSVLSSKRAVIYLLGPAILLFLLWKALTRAAPMQRTLGFTFRPAQVAAYYATLVGSVALALALAGYLYSQFEKQANRGKGVVSWQVGRLRS